MMQAMDQQLSVSCTSGEESTSLWKFCFQRRERGVPKNGFSVTGVSNNGLGFSDVDVSKHQVHGILTMLFANEAWVALFSAVSQAL